MHAVVDKVSLDLSSRRGRRGRTLRDGDRVSAGGVIESVQPVVPIEPAEQERLGAVADESGTLARRRQVACVPPMHLLQLGIRAGREIVGPRTVAKVDKEVVGATRDNTQAGWPASACGSWRCRR